LKPLCGSDVGNGEGSKNSTRTGGLRYNDASTTASNAFGASEVLEELEEELKSEHEVNQTSNGPIIIPGQTLHKNTSCPNAFDFSLILIFNYG
jgi:hypothetical protein